MKSVKTFFIKNWYWVLPLIFPLFTAQGMVEFFLEIKYTSLVSDAAQVFFNEGIAFEIIRYIFCVIGRIIFIGYGLLSIFMVILARWIPKPLLIPILIGGLIGILWSWIIQVILFHLPFYGPDPPTDGQYAFIIFEWPFKILPYFLEGVLAGLFLTFCIGLILSLTSNLVHYHLNPRKRNWYLVSAMIILSMFIFLILPLNIKRGYTQKVRSEAKSENISQERLMQIYLKANNTKNFQLISILARNQKTPDSILEEIYLTASESKKFQILSELVWNPQIPEEILYKIYEFCQHFIDDEPKSAELLSVFISSHWRSIRVLEGLAQSQNTPGSLLKELAESNQESVRRNLAGNENTSIEILEMLSNDIDHTVRNSILFNPNVTKEILLKLKLDSIEEVSSMADYQLKKRGFTDD